MIQRPLLQRIGIALLVVVASWFPPKTAESHPHVFIDGSVDFLVNEQGAVQGLSVTWRYDAFETLYVLASIGIVPDKDGTLSTEQRETLIHKESSWPEGFDGASHLSIDGTPVPISGPKSLDADVKDGRLIVRFRRDLDAPELLWNRRTEVAFFERTYYYAFKITTPPRVVGGAPACNVDMVPSVPEEHDEAILNKLAALDREETPEDTNIGALFADRILLTCAS